jgi:hypothetical protein
MKNVKHFLASLTLLFIAMKLTGFIAWSWWLVLLPIIGPIGLLFLGLVVYFIYWMSLTQQERDILEIQSLLRKMSDHYKHH